MVFILILILIIFFIILFLNVKKNIEPFAMSNDGKMLGDDGGFSTGELYIDDNHQNGWWVPYSPNNPQRLDLIKSAQKASTDGRNQGLSGYDLRTFIGRVYKNKYYANEYYSGVRNKENLIAIKNRLDTYYTNFITNSKARKNKIWDNLDQPSVPYPLLVSKTDFYTNLNRKQDRHDGRNSSEDGLTDSQAKSYLKQNNDLVSYWHCNEDDLREDTKFYNYCSQNGGGKPLQNKWNNKGGIIGWAKSHWLSSGKGEGRTWKSDDKTAMQEQLNLNENNMTEQTFNNKLKGFQDLNNFNKALNTKQDKNEFIDKNLPQYFSQAPAYIDTLTDSQA